MVIFGWRLVQYVDFLWLHMSNVMINVLRGKKKKERRLLYWVLDVGIFPLCRLSYPLPEVPGSQCHKWKSQSLFIITLTFNIKNTFKHD